MRFCKKFVTFLLCFFYIFTPLTTTGQSFSAIDLERLLRNHPLTKSYDHKSGRFKNTASEIIPPEKLSQQIAQLESSLSAAQAKKSEIIRSSVLNDFDAEKEEQLWDKLKTIDNTIEKQQQELAQKKQLMHTDGIPDISTVVEIIKGILRDVRIDYRKERPPNSIVINRLPRFPTPPPTLENGADGLLSFFYRGDPAKLTTYLKHAYAISLLFGASSSPILYQREGD